MDLVLINPSEAVIHAKCLMQQELAQSEKVKVGCVVMGWNGSKAKYFGGSNIELSTSYTTHSEYLALLDCIHNRYYPQHLYVTSQSEEECVFLCGCCRQQYLEVNEKCLVTVFNPNGTKKDTRTISSLLPLHKDVKDKNFKFRSKFVI